MSRSDYVLIGTDEPVDAVVNTLAQVLGTEPRTVGRNNLWFPLGDDVGAWLDRDGYEPFDSDPPEYAGATWELEIQGRDAARDLYEQLSAATGWKLVLIDGNFGPTLAVREALTRA